MNAVKYGYVPVLVYENASTVLHVGFAPHHNVFISRLNDEINLCDLPGAKRFSYYVLISRNICGLQFG